MILRVMNKSILKLSKMTGTRTSEKSEAIEAVESYAFTEH